ncbi:MAG: hypothetical protein OHK0039_08090 [Bacteroidia bacterium]
MEIANLNYFLQFSRQNQPWIIMHELSHAYHDRVLGYTYAPISSAYDAAMTAGLYDDVLYNPGNGQPPFSQPAYARLNAQEYFAEITEAYLGENDYYPFVRADLLQHDTLGYALTASIWEFGEANSLADQDRLGLRVYPIPAGARLHVAWEQPAPGHLWICDALGRRLHRVEWSLPSRECQIDVGAWPAGVYWVQLQTQTGYAFVRWIKA